MCFELVGYKKKIVLCGGLRFVKTLCRCVNAFIVIKHLKWYLQYAVRKTNTRLNCDDGEDKFGTSTNRRNPLEEECELDNICSY